MNICKRALTMVIIISMVTALVPVLFAEEQAKININAASVEDLIQIKGIGQKYALRIVDYREKNGPFSQIEDLMKIKGIGSKKFESIKDQITAELPKE